MFAENIKKNIEKALKELDIKPVPFVIEHPENESFGDYSTNIAMVLAKTLKLSPLETAKKISKNIPTRSPISKITVEKPGFINFWLEERSLAENLETIVKEKNLFGSSRYGKGKKWLVEHTSPNPNKAMHLGHLRNNVLGMSLSNIWAYMSIEVVRDCIDNDRGIAIAKLMWGYLKFGRKNEDTPSLVDYWYDHKNEWTKPEDLNMRPDRFVDDLYYKGSKDFTEDETAEEFVRKLVVSWEQGDKKVWGLWSCVLKFSHEGQDTTLLRLGSRWDKIWHESDHYNMGKDIVESGLKRRIFRKLEDGAILSNLEKYNIPDTILMKRDGTSLYITQDIALTKLKKQTYHPQKMFWVVGPDQNLALKQLFAICEQLGIGKREEFTHLSFGYMSIKGTGKMSSRLGNVVYIDDLIDKAKDKILKKTSNKEIAEKAALGAIKYSILKVGRTTDIVFDFETSLSFEGDSGPYLQYTYARCKSVLGSEKKNILKSTMGKPNEEELLILKHIYKFPEEVEKAGLEYSPNYICSFLFELAKRYNAFYAKHSVLKASTDDQKNFRLLITQATAQVLENGLTLLGIFPLERM